MDPRWRTIIDHLYSTDFAELAGARATFTVPVSDRLVSRLARSRLPSTAPVQDLDIRAEADNGLAIQFRLAKPSFLPLITVRVRIDRQPELPHSPLLVCRLRSQGIATVAGVLTRVLPVLPPGVTLTDDRVVVDLEALARRAGAAQLFKTLTAIAITTAPGVLLVELSGGLPPRA